MVPVNLQFEQWLYTAKMPARRDAKLAGIVEKKT